MPTRSNAMAAPTASGIKGCWKPTPLPTADGYYADLIEEAAALWESLAQNHPFIDGNKRTAFAATYTFLAINGARLTADAQETYVFVAALYEANQFSFDKLVPWLRSHVTQNPSADHPG